MARGSDDLHAACDAERAKMPATIRSLTPSAIHKVRRQQRSFVVHSIEQAQQLLQATAPFVESM